MASRGLIVGGLSILACAVAIAGCEATGASDVETYEVKRGEFRSGVTVTGELSAVQSTMIQAPPIHWRFGDLKFAKLVDDGAQVKEGDLLAQFDPSEVQKAVADAKSEVEIAEAELRKAVATHRSQAEELVIDHEIAKLNLETQKLQLAQATFKAEIERKQIELELENAGISLKRAEEEIENKKKINAEEQSKLRLQLDQARSKLQTAQETLQMLTVKAPSAGIAIIQRNPQTREKFQLDDRTWMGFPIIGLPDLSRMQAEVVVSEVDVAKVRMNQEALVRVDAFRDTTFAATVTEVAALARNKERDSKVKVFDAKVRIEGTDPRLMPGMTVSCEVVVSRVPDALLVPVDAVFRDEDKTFVYIAEGGGFDRRDIRTEAESDSYVVVKEGLKEGDRVALRDPTLERRERGEE